ncbi:unnamed protein product [Bursaphelenchus xylophilus]|uniref:(pine wood nematode) hypothetical protein n=1 Tax=Bursaphelenchus xylophilus TaxID=6326 RepID=A0A1I7S642_BURXY|nr:unnamed protein product [Bursaphelenchus xylophilus]CAG9082288.1 unnamed protein product [Bursaphelenchus xylophilus]
MGTYKWYMVASIVSELIYTLTLASYHHQLLAPYRVSAGSGILEYFKSEKLMNILEAIGLTLFQTYVVVMLCRFVFRYFQSTAKEAATKLMSDKKFFVILALVFVATLAFNCYYYITTFYGGDDWKLQFPDNDTKLKEYVMAHTLSVTNGREYYSIGFLWLVYPTIVFIGTFCTVQCYRFQQNPKNRLSEKTKSMYSVLIYGLVIEQAAEFAWYVVPYFSITYFGPFNKRFILFLITYRWFYAYPTFQMIFTLAFYKRYRAAAVSIWSDSDNFLNILEASSYTFFQNGFYKSIV